MLKEGCGKDYDQDQDQVELPWGSLLMRERKRMSEKEIIHLLHVQDNVGIDDI